MKNENWTTFIFVRHGETLWNSQGRWQGWQDSDLTERGREQARDVARELPVHKATRIVASDAGRALATAQIIGEHLGLEPTVTPALRERFYGEYEGMTSEEIDAKFPGTRYVEGRDLRETWRPIGGENLLEVASRVMVFVREAATSFPGETIIAVTHAGVLRVLDSLHAQESLDSIWHRVPPNCGVLILQANPEGDLRLVQHFCPTEDGSKAG